MRFIGRMDRLAGKVAFITGAARGQGRSHAIRLASEGADVILGDVCGPVETNGIPASEPGDLEQTVKAVEALGRRIVWGQVDVRDAAAVRALVDRGVEELGHVDVVVANAAILNWAKSHELTEEQWQTVIDENLTGVFHTVQSVLPHLLRQGTGGSIIITSSFAALKGTPFTLSYTAAKYGVVGIAKAIAHEYGDYNIRANTVHPCGVNTPMGTQAGGLMELVGERAATVGPLFMNTLPVAMVEPEDISATVAWLASDDAKYVTGAQIPVDAGADDR
jgi:SDR family mycofactocin-dependent oxidoreductase